MRYPKDYKPITPLEYATEQLTKALKRLEQSNQRPEVQAMIKQALEAAAKGSEAAEKLAADLKKVLKVKQSEENKAHGEQLKALRAQVREAASKCIDLEQLAAALNCLSGGFEINYSIE